MVYPITEEYEEAIKVAQKIGMLDLTVDGDVRQLVITCLNITLCLPPPFLSLPLLSAHLSPLISPPPPLSLPLLSLPLLSLPLLSLPSSPQPYNSYIEDLHIKLSRPLASAHRDEAMDTYEAS